jgi:hypothetical protein
MVACRVGSRVVIYTLSPSGELVPAGGSTSILIEQNGSGPTAA